MEVLISWQLSNQITWHIIINPLNKKNDLSTFGYGLGMGSGWVHISLLPIPYPYFKIRENPNSIKSEKTRQIGVGLGGYPWVRVLLPCLNVWKKTFNKMFSSFLVRRRATSRSVYRRVWPNLLSHPFNFYGLDSSINPHFYYQTQTKST